MVHYALCTVHYGRPWTCVREEIRVNRKDAESALRSTVRPGPFPGPLLARRAPARRRAPHRRESDEHQGLGTGFT
jgi:hypothetical protein